MRNCTYGFKYCSIGNSDVLLKYYRYCYQEFLRFSTKHKKYSIIEINKNQVVGYYCR